jgi:hypothetical protein
LIPNDLKLTHINKQSFSPLENAAAVELKRVIRDIKLLKHKNIQYLPPFLVTDQIIEKTIESLSPHLKKKASEFRAQSKNATLQRITTSELSDLVKRSNFLPERLVEQVTILILNKVNERLWNEAHAVFINE